MKENAVEDLGEVGVEVLRHVSTDVASLAQLTPDALQGLFVDAHCLISIFN